MTEKRFTTDNGSNEDVCLVDNITGKEYESNFDDIVDLLNEQHETIQNLNQQLRIFSDGLKAEIRETKEVFEDYSECVDEKKQLKEENEQLKQQLNYIQNSISEHIKHQKTELGQKALKEIIEDYNEWLLGHKELQE